MMRDNPWFILCSCLLAPAACADDTPDDGDADVTRFEIGVENLSQPLPFFAAGTFAADEGGGEPGPLAPGASASVEFHAPPGARLSFAAMFVPSNDLFFAPSGEGIALFDDQGQPVSGDLSDQVFIWDAGTELDEALGLGQDQAPTQAAPGAGAADPNETVRLASEGFPGLPAASELLAVSLSAGEGNRFTLHIENRSDGQSLVLADETSAAVPVSPGVFVVHHEPNPLFEVGTSTRGEGLEALAEDGDPAALATTLAALSGVVSPLAPGLWLVHDASEAGLFVEGAADLGQGLEQLAEDGDPTSLVASLAQANAGVFGGIYGDDIAPLEPGFAFLLEIEARPGERLSIASMLGQSNDVFLGSGPDGIALFDPEGVPLAGDITASLQLWDAGTEVNEAPGAGPNQAPRQSAPNTGQDEDGVVHPVDDGFDYPAMQQLVRVTIEPI